MKIPNFIQIKFVESNGELTPEAVMFLSQLISQLQFNFSDQGLYPPQLTADEIAAINNLSANGAIVYNKSTNKLMVNEGGTFKTIQTL